MRVLNEAECGTKLSLQASQSPLLIAERASLRPRGRCSSRNLRWTAREHKGGIDDAFAKLFRRGLPGVGSTICCQPARRPAFFFARSRAEMGVCKWFTRKEHLMNERQKLNKPWLVAVWPGMGNVALSAGYYLMAKLGMHAVAELSAPELFDVDHVEVKDGLVRPVQLPRSRFFVWKDPNEKHDIVVFIGEAQPPLGKYQYCRRLIEYAKEIGVERVFAFAAMATQMHPEHSSRVFGAATDEKVLGELKRLELQLLENGHIGGLNGVLVGVAAEFGLNGACLLGEMPHIFSQLPFPKASLAILEVFTTVAGIDLDLGELSEQAKAVEEMLGELLAKVEESIGAQLPGEEEEYRPEPAEEGKLSPADEEHIEQLFSLAAEDRSKAYELKSELDRLQIFKDYEDRFLDLFKQSE